MLASSAFCAYIAKEKYAKLAGKLEGGRFWGISVPHGWMPVTIFAKIVVTSTKLATMRTDTVRTEPTIVI